MIRLKAVVLSTSLFVLFLSVSCNKQEPTPAPAPVHTKELPELFEDELLDFFSKEWKDLSDTLSYFYKNLFSEGFCSGAGPDGIMYSLEICRTQTSIDATFSIQDSVWMKLSGTLSPPEISLEACDATIRLHRMEDGRILADTGKLGFTFQISFETTYPETEIIILMNNSRIGFFSIEPFEYPDYTTGYCLVAHFDDSPVSLCYRDKLGLFYLLPYFFEGK